MRLWITLLLLITTSLACAKDRELYLYNWSEYMPESVLEQFQQESGIKVYYTTYDSNEAMYAKIRLLDKSNSYDLAVPSTYYVSKMRREGLLHPIMKSRMKNFGNYASQLVNRQFDPNNEYSVPYLWGSTGIAINRAAIEQDVTRWADLWKPEFKGRVLLTNDMREVMGMGLLVMGYSGNSTSEAEIKAAYEKLRTLIPNVRAYNSDAPRMPYIEGETDLGMIWNGEAVMGREDLDTLEYVYPQEGAILWMDSFVIPKNARNIPEAYEFLNFITQPEIAKVISEEIGYATPNVKAIRLLDDAVQQDEAVYPSEALLEKAEFQIDVGDAITVYEKYWQLLKAGQ